MNDFSPITISSFKAYDIRGELGKNLDEDIAYRCLLYTSDAADE